MIESLGQFLVPLMLNIVITMSGLLKILNVLEEILNYKDLP